MKKFIIGLIGSDKAQEIASEILVKDGFHNVSMLDVVRGMAKLLTPSINHTNKFLEEFKKHGEQITSNCWINMALQRIPMEKEKAFITYILPSECISVVKPLYIACESENIAGENIFIVDDEVKFMERIKNMIVLN